MKIPENKQDRQWWYARCENGMVAAEVKPDNRPKLDGEVDCSNANVPVIAGSKLSGCWASTAGAADETTGSNARAASAGRGTARPGTADPRSYAPLASARSIKNNARS